MVAQENHPDLPDLASVIVEDTPTCLAEAEGFTPDDGSDQVDNPTSLGDRVRETARPAGWSACWGLVESSERPKHVVGWGVNEKSR